jgi:cytochrome c553
MGAMFPREEYPSMLRIAVMAAFLAVTTAAWADTIEDKAALCDECHGLNGVPQYPTAPIIWGQNAGYLYLQFRDFQKGARKDDRMTPIAQGLVKADALALAEYFAAKPWPNLDQPAASKADATLAMTAISSVVCTSCHSSNFLGDSSVPRVAGQNREYLLKTMTDFRNHTRGNNPGMSDLMNTVTPEQLTAIAAYLAGL